MKSEHGLLPVRWWIAVMLFLSYVVWYMDRTNISIAGPLMMKHFGWTPAQFGMVQSAFFIGYSLTQIPGGWLADRFGGSRVILFGTLWWSAFVFFTPFATTLGMMYLIRGFMGLGEGVNAPTHVALTARWMPKFEAARANAVYWIGMPVGIIITMPLTVWLSQKWGWQASFYIFAWVGVAWCIAWRWYARDRPEQHPTITKAELALIKSDQDPVHVMDQPTEWRAVLTSRAVWGLTITYFFHNYLWYLYMSWLPSYLVMARGFSLVKSGIFTMIPYFCATLTILLGGHLSDKWTRKYGLNVGRRVPIVIGLGGCGIFLLLATYTPNAYVAVAYISASMGFLLLNNGAFWSTPISLSPKNSGVISGMMNTSGNIAGVCSPSITGILVTMYHNKFEYAMYFGACMALVGILVLLLVAKMQPLARPSVTGAASGTYK
jgi:sugar phosphate permease